jgi:hypothetical protein
MDSRLVGAAQERILTDLVVTFDGQTERSLIHGLALKARVTKEALRRLLEAHQIYAISDGPSRHEVLSS